MQQQEPESEGIEEEGLSEPTTETIPEVEESEA